MIFVLLEEPTLLVLGDIVEVRREIEPLDAADSGFRFFDEQGRALTPTFPHRSGRRFLGMLLDNDPGPYELLPAPAGSPSTLEAALTPKIGIHPNSWFSSIDEVRRHLAAARPTGGSEHISPAG
jgi:hypothetical protein